MWSVLFVDREGSPWGWDREARSNALWMESCLEVASTTKGDGLSRTLSQFISKMDLQRCAMGSSQPDGLITLLLRMCQWAMLVEACIALRYLRAWTRFFGRGSRTEGLAQMNSLSSRKYERPYGGRPSIWDSCGNRFSERGTSFCMMSVGWENCWIFNGHSSSSV